MSIAPGSYRAALTRPVFIVSPPRSGSTLLFQTLAQSPDFCTIGNESHAIMESIPAFHPARHGFHSNRLTADQLDPAATEELSRRFLTTMRTRDGAMPASGQRLLEKTPKNSLRVPLLKEAWPDARFLFLYREARPTLASMMEAWESGRFRTYPRLPDWPGEPGGPQPALPWSLLLVPGWRDLRGRPLPEVVAHQWATTIEVLIDDLEALDEADSCALGYENFLADPQGTMKAACASLGVSWDRELEQDLPLSRFTVSKPDPGKWKRREAEIESVWPIVADAEDKARGFLERRSVLS